MVADVQREIIEKTMRPDAEALHPRPPRSLPPCAPSQGVSVPSSPSPSFSSRRPRKVTIAKSTSTSPISSVMACSGPSSMVRDHIPLPLFEPTD